MGREREDSPTLPDMGSPNAGEDGRGAVSTRERARRSDRGHCLAVGWLQVTFSRVEQRCKVVLSWGRLASTETG